MVKFAGCYHGHVDSLLAEAGSGSRHHPSRRRARHARRPGRLDAATLVLPFNDRAAVEAAFAERGSEIACLVTEASPGNMGVVPPEPGFNEFLAQTCARHGALFVSDEVMTGFRVSPRASGAWTARVEGWRPDLVTFGKVMGGGFPAAAFGGRADVMGMLSPDGPVYQAGTLSGNPVATTAGLATLRLATPEVYAHLDAAASTISAALGEALTRAGVPHVLQSAGNMFSVFLTSGRAGARLRRRLDAGHDGLPRVLPRHARPGRLPAPERVRGLVPLRRPRRPGDPARARRAAGRGPGCGARGSTTATATTMARHLCEHDRPPAAPR